MAAGRLARPIPGLLHGCLLSAPGGREGTHFTEEETEAASCGEWGLLSTVACSLLVAVSSLVEQRFRTQAQQLRCMGLVVLRHLGSNEIRD